MLDLETVAKLLLILGGFLWGYYGAFNVNLISYINILFLQKIIYIFIGLSAFFLIFKKNYYLTFLDKTFLPNSFFKNETQPDDVNYSVNILVNPKAKVLYWAAEQLKNDQDNYRDVKKAYGKFTNSGITIADISGNATLFFRKPGPYTVHNSFFTKYLSPHVHYRYTLNNGLLSEIFTIDLNKYENNFLNKNINKSSSQYCSTECCNKINNTPSNLNVETSKQETSKQEDFNQESLYENDLYYFDNNYADNI